MVEQLEQRLLDLSQPVDVKLLDQTIYRFYQSTNKEERVRYENLLKQFQELPQAWLQVDGIIDRSEYEQTKYFALQILEQVVRFRWGALTQEQRLQIRSYISNIIIAFAKDDSLFSQGRTFLNKVNLVLVQILKHDWPQNWPEFMKELVGASKTDQNLCENSMYVLRLLSEEVFDFSQEEMVQAKTKLLKQQFTSDFQLIHELCTFVLENSNKPTLLRSTLQTLQVFLTWIPLPYIFKPPLIQRLLHLFPDKQYQNPALKCLTEIGSLEIQPQYAQQMTQIYTYFINLLTQWIPDAQMPQIAQMYEESDGDGQTLFQNMAQFLTGFLKPHLKLLETQDLLPHACKGLEYLIQISYVNDNEVFKTVLDYWIHFVPQVYSINRLDYGAGSPKITQSVQNTKERAFKSILQSLTQVMIIKMARPEEVIILEDDNGNIVRETMKDVDVQATYKQMREILVYLCGIDHEDTEQQMLARLKRIAPEFRQIASIDHGKAENTSEAWSNLNTLCWAIGSISGSMLEQQESSFLVAVIKELLNLCENTRGKDNKAVIASCIMYVVGQYPRFLRAHWKFLKTVVHKLFEFMHEKHPGVQDMACDTFLKICQKCKRKFITTQCSESQPFVTELLLRLEETVQDLQMHQIFQFYQAVGILIQAEADASDRRRHIEMLMRPPNQRWTQRYQEAGANPEILKSQDYTTEIINILNTNIHAAKTVGPSFSSQISELFTGLLEMYQWYSGFIGTAIVTGGQYASKSAHVKQMRNVKRYIVKLLNEFAMHCTDVSLLRDHFFPRLEEPILQDYSKCDQDVKEQEVLQLCATIVNQLQVNSSGLVNQILITTFAPTLTMITKNMEDYPDHRIHFFELLQAIIAHCFKTFVQMSSEQVKLIMDSIFWAVRHTERNVAETGLQLLFSILIKFDDLQLATEYYKQYCVTILQEIFAVLTDTCHKPGFPLQSKILHHIFGTIQAIQHPLWDPTKATYADNRAYIVAFVSQLLAQSFPNMTPQQIEACVRGMCDFSDLGYFKNHLRDFLVQTKQFALQDNAALYAEEVIQQTMQQNLSAPRRDSDDEDMLQANGL